MKKGNIDKAAECLGISQRRVHGLVAESVFPPPKRGMHNIWQLMVLYDNYLRRTNKSYRLAREGEQLQPDIDAGVHPTRFVCD